MGKLALLRAMHQRRNPAGRFSALDAAEAGAGDWLVLCLARVVDPDGLDRDLVYQEQEARIADTLRLLYEEKRLFSLIPIQLA